MSLKDNLKSIKTDLNAEEKMIENFIKSERFIKKYKKYIFLIAIIAVLWFAISFGISKVEEYNKKESNRIYTQLLKYPNDTNLLNQLKQKNVNLYAVFLINEIQNDNNNTNLKNQLKAISSDSDINPLLQNIIFAFLGEKSIFLKDYDKLLEACKLLEENKIEQANVLLSQINENSGLKQIAKNLKHYQGISQ
ncbi:hypothetical protein [Campylobacter taeniopygiae]|uniref:Tetratricopeptide repeat-like domain-containing protein n=1 Tax=Campylobacter taeniopygiae TaxID=2510188 RepID=A0ABY2TKA3_9BACT|nr:hypothetical protein [Campylobacter taeniopygiae]TKX34544.1 hypothetical protein CQA75_01145 [Campylobacter taeniopygiae]